jgi:hypothetical protein
MTLVYQLEMHFNSDIFSYIWEFIGRCLDEKCMIHPETLNICPYCCRKCRMSSAISSFKHIPCDIIKYETGEYTVKLNPKIITGFACSDWCAEYISATTVICTSRHYRNYSDAVALLSELDRKKYESDEQHEDDMMWLKFRNMFV